MPHRGPESSGLESPYGSGGSWETGRHVAIPAHAIRDHDAEVSIGQIQMVIVAGDRYRPARVPDVTAGWIPPMGSQHTECLIVERSNAP